MNRRSQCKCVKNVKNTQKINLLVLAVNFHYCLKCAGVSEALYACIERGEMTDFHWTCPCCKNMFPSLDNISRSLNDMQSKNEERMTKLENRMGNSESFTKGEVKNTVLSMKSEILEELKLGANELVDKRSSELDDRRRRELNITIFNLPEYNSTIGMDKKESR